MLAARHENTIVGMGVSGLSCARYFAANNMDFCVVDTREKPGQIDQFRKEFPGVSLYCGDDAISIIENSHCLVMSPGVSSRIPPVEVAVNKGAILTNDVDIFSKVAQKPIIAITGSNGKTTVTTIVGEMLSACGYQVNVCGNIGKPVLDVLTYHEFHDLSVIELSSFQLEIAKAIPAKVSVVLNITQDHMDRYENFEEYAAAKHNIFNLAQVAVIHVEDKLTVPANSTLKTISVSMLDEASDFYLQETAGGIALKKADDVLLFEHELKIKGQHNTFNALVSLAMISAFGADLDPCIEALKSFSGLPHRCEWVAEVNEVEFFNDSKATNVGAAIAAIQGLHKNYSAMVLIAGGLDKDSDFSPLAEIVKDRVSDVILFGQDANKIEEAIKDQADVVIVDSLEQAVNKSIECAKPGSAVLFSPACASFDMFSGYEERGERFKSLVRGLN